MIQVWYPAASGGPPAAYIAPGVGRVYAAEYKLPSTTFTRVRTNAHRDARPLERPGGYPAVRAPVPVLGAIRARRALRIERAYLDAFFARDLSGAAAPLLDTPSPVREVHLMR